jgi:hypothetical protein
MEKMTMGTTMGTCRGQACLPLNNIKVNRINRQQRRKAGIKKE